MLDPWVYGPLIAAAFFFGAVVAWLGGQVKIARCQARYESEEAKSAEFAQRAAALAHSADTLHAELGQARAEATEWRGRAEHEARSASEKQAMLMAAENRLADTFKALSSDALKSNQEQFLLLARTAWEKQSGDARQELESRHLQMKAMLDPVGETLTNFDRRVAELELAREGAYVALKEQVKALQESQLGLRNETSRLVRALRQPSGRGQWGELQLRRVVELAGMREHCDFELQSSTTNEDGDTLRPDMLVHLPGGRHVVVDAKTPMDAYLELLDARDDESRSHALARHARHVRTHIQQLAAKNYPARHQPGPEFTVLFLPSEAIFAAALDQDPGLIEKGITAGVVLATPTTLIALLRIIHQGWREETLAANARVISALGRRLHDRLGGMNSHLGKLGRSLGQSVEAYNRTLGVFETRVLADARRFVELGAADDEESCRPLSPIELAARPPKDSAALPDEMVTDVPETQVDVFPAVPSQATLE